MGTEKRRLFCIRCEPADYGVIQTNLATLAERTGLPRGRTLARLLEGTVKARRKSSESSEAKRTRTEAARAAKAAKQAAKRAAKAEPAAEPTTPDAT